MSNAQLAKGSVMTNTRPTVDKQALFDNLWDYQALAAYFGVTVQTCRNWVSKKRIPFIRIGRVVRFDPHAILEVVRQRSE